MTKSITIFEGPDGSGKTTLATAFAEATGATYVHHGPYPGLGGEELVDTYARSMLTAVTGYSDVVMDRCWISETPYGLALRDGADRVNVRRAELAALAKLCRANVVLCLPPFQRVLGNYIERRRAELLEREAQLERVHAWYARSVAHNDRRQVHWAFWRIRTLVIDPFKHSNDENVKLVKEFIHADV